MFSRREGAPLQAARALTLVRVASLCYALDTLTWGERHNAQEVIRRGIKELSTLSCEERSCEDRGGEL